MLLINKISLEMFYIVMLRYLVVSVVKVVFGRAFSRFLSRGNFKPAPFFHSFDPDFLKYWYKLC